MAKRWQCDEGTAEKHVGTGVVRGGAGLGSGDSGRRGGGKGRGDEAAGSPETASYSGIPAARGVAMRQPDRRRIAGTRQMGQPRVTSAESRQPFAMTARTSS